MEDTKPRLLIKIIHFCQSWPGGQFPAVSINSFFSLSSYLNLLFFLSFSLFWATACIMHREKEHHLCSHCYLLNHCVSSRRLTSPLYILGLSRGKASHTYHEVKGWLPHCHLFLDFTAKGECRCNWILVSPPASSWAYRPTVEVSRLSRTVPHIRQTRLLLFPHTLCEAL